MKGKIMITILGATGNIGSRLTSILLEKGEKVRAIARSEDKLKSLAQAGAEIYAGDATNIEFLTKAFSGAKAAFILIPPNLQAENVRAYENSVGEKIFEAIKKSEIKYIVNLSSIGADLSEGTGPVKGLYDQEQRLNKINGLNVLHLRPAYFMENTLMFTGMIKNNGIIGSPNKADLKLPMIATKDIAKAAAEELTARNFSGIKVRELYGQRDLTFNEIAKIYSEKIDKPGLQYIQFPYEDAETSMIKMGLSVDMAKQFSELSKAFNIGLIKIKPRNSNNTTETSIEEFANIFAAVYKK